MKKILIVTNNLIGGGAERVITTISNYFSSRNIKVIIVIFKNYETFYKLSSDVEIIPIKSKSKIRIIEKIKQYLEIRKIVKNHNPDIILSMPEEIAIYTVFFLLGIRVPIVVSERNNPWIMPSKKITRICRRLFYPCASGFIFQTRDAANYFSRKIQKKSVVIPNPLDLSIIPEPWKGKRRKEIVSVGRLEAQKNHKLLISAFKLFYDKHPDYVLKIYGEGSLRIELESYVNSILPKGAVVFPGQKKDILTQINGASIFVLSSDYEGMPNALIEAMAIGMPVISTDCPSGGPAELIEDGINGLLVPVGDNILLYKSMCKIVENNDYALYLGANAELIKNKLNSSIIVKQWEDFLYNIWEKNIN